MQGKRKLPMNLVSVVLVSALTTILSPAQVNHPASRVPKVAQTPTLAVPVKSLSVAKASMAEALTQIRNRNVEHVVIGFESIPHREGESGGPISLTLDDTTLGEAVRLLCQADPRYEYKVIESSMIDVGPKYATSNTEDLLNMKIRHYHISARIGAAEAIQHIAQDAPELREFLYRKAREWAEKTGTLTGSPGSNISGNMPPPFFTVDLDEVTVRQILNAISLKSIEMFKQGKNYAPVGWKYEFIIDANAPTGLGGYPKWSAF